MALSVQMKQAPLPDSFVEELRQFDVTDRRETARVLG